MMTPRRLRDDERLRAGDFCLVNPDTHYEELYPLTSGAGLSVASVGVPVYRKRTLLVLGHGGHGKGEFCRLLSELYGAECLSSSEAALPHIFPALQMATCYDFDCDEYKDEADAYEQRGINRPLWKALISLYNTPDKATLAREVLSRAEVYDGMRCAEEFEASRHLFDLVVWVDAGWRVPAVDSSMGIKCEVADVIIDNNETIAGLTERVHEFAASWGLTPATS